MIVRFKHWKIYRDVIYQAGDVAEVQSFQRRALGNSVDEVCETVEQFEKIIKEQQEEMDKEEMDKAQAVKAPKEVASLGPAPRNTSKPKPAKKKPVQSA